MVLDDTTESDNGPRLEATTSLIEAPVPGVAAGESLVDSHTLPEEILYRQGAVQDAVLGLPATPYHHVVRQDGMLRVVDIATALTLHMSNIDCVPVIPEPQNAAVDAGAAKETYLPSLLEQGTPPQLTINVDTVVRQQESNAAMGLEVTLARDSSFVDLDEVDDSEMEKSMAKLAALAQELRGGVVVKQVRVDPFLTQLGKIAGATPSFLQGCSQVSASECAVDVKPNVADIWRARVAEGTSARKRKREIEVLKANQTRLLDIVQKEAMQQEELMKALRQFQGEIAYLCQFAPPAAAKNTFHPDQQSQLFSAISCGASPADLGGRVTVPPTQLQGTSEGTYASLVHSIAASNEFPRLEREVELPVDIAPRDVSIVVPDTDG